MSKEMIKEIGKLSVIELAQLIKDLEAEFGVSAAAPVAVAGPASAAAAPASGAVGSAQLPVPATDRAGTGRIRPAPAERVLQRPASVLKRYDISAVIVNVCFTCSEDSSKSSNQESSNYKETRNEKITKCTFYL
jgi:hypothetical protein